jgi:hypothetical protein
MSAITIPWQCIQGDTRQIVKMVKVTNIFVVFFLLLYVKTESLNNILMTVITDWFLQL